jgi:hypothetical protein
MGLMIDGIAAVEAPDKTAEIISIKGMNIDNLEQGLGMFNVEHVSPGLGADGKPPENNLQNIHSFNTFIGRVEYVHKIYEKSDCEDERQEAYWDHVKVPFLYCRGELFDDEDHQGAKAAAAVIRHYHKRGLPIRIMFSIEGDTLDKKGGMITDSIAKHIACTIKPCNAAAISGVYSDGGKIDKSNISLQKNENYVTSFESPFFNIQSLQKAEEKLDYLPLQKMFDSPLDLVDPMQQRYHQLIDAATHHLVAAKMCEFIAKTNNTAHHINHAAEAPQHQVKAQHHAMQAAVVFGKIHGYTPKASNLFVHKDIANHMKKQYSNVDPDAIIAQHHPMDSELSMIPDEPEFLGKAAKAGMTKAEVAEEMKKKRVNKLRKISQNAIKRFNKLPDQVTIDEDIKLKKSLLSKADTTIPRI